MLEDNYFKDNSVVNKVLNCTIQDETGLNDFQQLDSQVHIAIPKVGINRFRLPITLHYPDGEVRSHDAEASMYMGLKANKTGVNMSRLCDILQRESLRYSLTQDFFHRILSCYQEELKDFKNEEIIENVFLKINFNYVNRQPSLKSDNWGWQYYPVCLEAKKYKNEEFKFFISTEYEYSSTCPCSLSMAKQYEREYQEKKTNEGTGIGIPHSQRSKLKCTIELKENSTFFIQDLLLLLRKAIPTETQSLVKRVDEQAFAILNGMNPMFVEHACRNIHYVLDKNKEIKDWICSFEHFESLHSHNAAAVIYKGVEGGLKDDDIF